VQQASPTTELAQGSFGRPNLMFFSELSSSALRQTLAHNQLIDDLARQGYGIALGLSELSADQAELVRMLNQRRVAVVAWLQLPISEGLWLNLKNYPQVIERYRAFRGWAQQYTLQFAAVGLDIEPPPSEADRVLHWGPRDIARRLWLAHENVLYPAARSAYVDLIAEMHHDGYEVHVYQLPLVADDRRAGTTIMQRALDVIDLPADVEVLMCYSSLPADQLGNDLGGALIASYGPAADAIGVGSIGGSSALDGDSLPQLSWEALERDLLLAARHTDIMYIYSLEGCVERDLLSRIAQIDWSQEPSLSLRRRLLIGTLRAALLIILLIGRFSRRLLAWLGWLVAGLLFFRQLRAWQREHEGIGSREIL
jgi:hypothetical protein